MAMRALQLDYQRVHRPVPWLGLAILVAALAGLAALAAYHQSLTRQLRFWQDQADGIARQSAQRAPASRPHSEQAARAQLLEVRSANQVVLALDVPWNALFKAVETAGGKGIALLSLEPDTQKGTIKISGEAKDLDVLLEYVKRLSASDVFSGVFLQTHQVQRDVPEKPLRFALLAHWKGPAP
jgi:hypothetical protein